MLARWVKGDSFRQPLELLCHLLLGNNHKRRAHHALLFALLSHGRMARFHALLVVLIAVAAPYLATSQGACMCTTPKKRSCLFQNLTPNNNASPRLLLLLLLLSTSSHKPTAPPPPCSGHGTLDQWTKQCTCENAWPASPGDTGWTGAICQAQVTAIPAQTIESHTVQTALLDASSWKCFAMPVPVRLYSC
jgi:hypothetical protein